MQRVCAAAWAGCMVALVAAAGGCSHTATRSFEDRPRHDVWDAVIQVSKEPRYPDWVVVENQVHIVDEAQTVHVYRELKRDLVTPGLKPYREDVSWRFTAIVLPGDPLTVEFSSPDWAVPAHFWAQADQFFSQVRLRLVEMGPVTPAPGDPMGGRAAPAARDPHAPGDVPPTPAPGHMAEP